MIFAYVNNFLSAERIKSYMFSWIALLIRQVDSSNNDPPRASNTGGKIIPPVEIILAGSVDRFVAWLIDFIIVSIGLGILFALLAFPFWFSYYSNGPITSGTTSLTIRILFFKIPKFKITPFLNVVLKLVYYFLSLFIMILY
jgi:hypothetical protein